MGVVKWYILLRELNSANVPRDAKIFFKVTSTKRSNMRGVISSTAKDCVGNIHFFRQSESIFCMWRMQSFSHCHTNLCYLHVWARHLSLSYHKLFSVFYLLLKRLGTKFNPTPQWHTNCDMRWHKTIFLFLFLDAHETQHAVFLSSFFSTILSLCDPVVEFCSFQRCKMSTFFCACAGRRRTKIQNVRTQSSFFFVNKPPKMYFLFPVSVKIASWRIALCSWCVRPMTRYNWEQGRLWTLFADKRKTLRKRWFLRPRPHWTQRESQRKSGRTAPCYSNSSIHITCTKQRITRQASEWDVAPFFRVRFSRRVQCGWGLKSLGQHPERTQRSCFPPFSAWKFYVSSQKCLVTTYTPLLCQTSLTRKLIPWMYKFETGNEIAVNWSLQVFFAIVSAQFSQTNGSVENVRNTGWK